MGKGEDRMKRKQRDEEMGRGMKAWKTHSIPRHCRGPLVNGTR